MEEYSDYFLFVLIGYAAWHIRGLIAKTSARLDKCENQLPKVDETQTAVRALEHKHEVLTTSVDHLGSDFNKMDRKFEDMQKDIQGLRKDITLLTVAVARSGQVAEPLDNIIQIAMKQSPRKLNENGMQIYEIIGGAEFLEQNKDTLLTALAESKPLTALDVEMQARVVLLQQTSTPVFNKIKNIIYNHPAIKATRTDGVEIDYEITLTVACEVLSLPLRDMYLKAHPELTEDVE